MSLNARRRRVYTNVKTAQTAVAPNEADVPGSEDSNMTMPNERTRAVIQTREFLVELSRDASLPDRVRRDAKFLLRHYPNRNEVLSAGRIEESTDSPVAPMGAIFSSTINP